MLHSVITAWVFTLQKLDLAMHHCRGRYLQNAVSAKLHAVVEPCEHNLQLCLYEGAFLTTTIHQINHSKFLMARGKAGMNNRQQLWSQLRSSAAVVLNLHAG